MNPLKAVCRAIGFAVVLVLVGAPVANLAIVALERSPPPRPPVVLWNPEVDRTLDTDGGAYRFDDAWMWEPAPGSLIEGDVVNAQSRRGPLASEDRGAGVRIVVLGGSQAFGHLVKDRESWPRRLEARLGESGTSFEVLNFASGAYSLAQGCVRFTGDAMRYRPRIVLIEFGDWAESSLAPSGLSDVERMAIIKGGWFRFEQSLINISLYRSLREWLGVKGPPPVPERRGRRRVSLPEMRAGIVWLVEAVRAAGALPVIVVPIRRADAYTTNGILQDYDRQIRDAAAESGAPLIDLQALRDADPRDAESGGVDVKTFFNDPYHPTPAGHDWIAKAIAGELTRLGIVKH